MKTNQCIGCGVCRLACPEDAISILFDRAKGNYSADVDEEKCTSCGACRKVCYGANPGHFITNDINTDLKETLRNQISIYYGYSTNHELRMKATSGGIVTAALDYLIGTKQIDAAIVASLRSGNPPFAEARIARTGREVRNSAGVKYCPVRLDRALGNLESNQRYAFVGLPCHVFAVRELVRTRKLKGQIVVFIGLFCGGVPSYSGTQYILRKYRLHDNPIRKLEYREGGWPGRLLVDLGESQLSVPYTEYWPDMARWFFLERCLSCLNGLNPLADLSVGDFWLHDSLTRDPGGTSIIVINSNTGKKMLSEAKDNGMIRLKEIENRHLMESQRSLISFKHKRFGARFAASRVLRKNHIYKEILRQQRIGFQTRALVDEMFMALGRFLAANKGRWKLFQLFKSFYRLFYAFINHMKHVFGRGIT